LLHGYITIAGISKQSAGGLIPKSQPESIHMSYQFLTEVLENLLYYFHDITLTIHIGRRAFSIGFCDLVNEISFRLFPPVTL